jgi:predicted nucleotidyltransferase component of viral defense system
MRLHNCIEDFKDLIALTSKELDLDPTIIEKDYWITHALYHLSKSEYKDIVVFKGGTSLTKCYEDLHRFSEDIDIALLAKGMNSSQIKKTLSNVEKVMNVALQPGEFKEERKSGDYRYTQFTYQSLFTGSLMELHPNIRFELTSFMHPHPYGTKMMGFFIELYLDKMKMKDVVQEFSLGKFELNVLAIERTVIEKLVSMIRMSYDPDMKELLTKTRHLYDLYMTYPLVKEFYKDNEKFVEMVDIVKLAECDSRFKKMYLFENK